MDQLIVFLKLTLLYLFMLVFQLRLISVQYDPHIGNLTASRVAKQKISDIFFNYSFGIPIPIVSLSIQYNYFKGSLQKYKIAHAIIVSSTGPLFYIFANQLFNNELASFAGALIYVISFLFPITGNWLIQSEHYENIFFLSGGALLLASGGSPVLSALGALLLGCCLLCKLPALLSIWLILIFTVKHYLANEVYEIIFIISFYLAPFISYVIAGALLNNKKTSQTKDRDNKRPSIIEIIKSVPLTYLYFYKRNPAKYIEIYLKYHFTEYVKQFLPIIILSTSFFLFGINNNKWIYILGVAIVSLIFILRMGFAYVYSFNIIICLTAGLAIFTVPHSIMNLLMVVVLGSVSYSWFIILKDPNINLYKKNQVQVTVYDVLAKFIRDNSAQDQSLFCNINRSMAFIYPLSERGLPCHANLLTIGGYGPRIDHNNIPQMIVKAGRELIAAITKSPPTLIIQSFSDAPIFNLAALEQYCGISYCVCSIINPFVVYRLTDRRGFDFEPDHIDISFLFNADQGEAANIKAASAFMQHLQRFQQIASLKDSSVLNECKVVGEERKDMTLEHATAVCPSLEDNNFTCVFLDTYYAAFLGKLYADNPTLEFSSYETQKAKLLSSHFGDSDYYSHGLQAAGFHSDNLIVNCSTLQSAWCRENNLPAMDMHSVILEQVKRLRPQIVYLQDVSIATQEFILALRQVADLIVAQHACPVPTHIDFAWFDVVFTAVPYLVEQFRDAGTACYYVPLAFDPRVNSAFIPFDRRIIDVSFVGGFSGQHAKGYPLLEHLAQTTPILCWGYGTETLLQDSLIHSRYQGEAWGQEMIKIFCNSKITINRHIDMAKNYACNMRLFEATGCGTLLITDYKDNLNELFEIGKEVVAYRSPEECAALVNYYLNHPEEAEAIARAGQARTLRDHTYERRMERTAEILERHLRYRREQDHYAAPDMSAISFGHTLIQQEQVSEAMTSAWQDKGIPIKQRALVQQSLAAMYRGEDMGAYRILAEIIKPHVFPICSILELGCSSGYCYEILEYCLNKPIDYTGVDYSEAMIAMAKDYYPKVKFYAADGASLFFADRQFHTVISSCILLHVPNYRDHIFETARVADKFIVASRTPICKARPTQFLKKFAYGVETVELIFNEEELVREFALNRFELLHAIEYQADPSADAFQTTYLFKRV